ncbi:MAG: hypothetical protein QOD38_388 [Acidimicrobiaceae bacterium]
MAELLASVDDEQLGAATPCPDTSLGDLIDHVGTFSTAFVAVARKEIAGTGAPPPADSSNLEPGWRERIARDLETLAVAWRDPAAWVGMTAAGGIDLPGEIAGLVALDELVVHGWDVAVTSGQPYDPPVEEIEGAASFLASFDPPRDGRLFGPIVPVPDDASPLHQLLGLTGRDPGWTPPS